MIRRAAAALLTAFVTGTAARHAERDLSIRLGPQVGDGQVDAIAVSPDLTTSTGAAA